MAHRHDDHIWAHQDVITNVDTVVDARIVANLGAVADAQAGAVAKVGAALYHYVGTA